MLFKFIKLKSDKVLLKNLFLFNIYLKIVFSYLYNPLSMSSKISYKIIIIILIIECIFDVNAYI